MSRHNRTRRRLWKLGLTKRQIGRKLVGEELARAIADATAAVKGRENALLYGLPMAQPAPSVGR